MKFLIYLFTVPFIFILCEDCLQKPNRRRCNSFAFRWYYDLDAKICRQYIYGGCDGYKTNNSFLSLNECLSNCFYLGNNSNISPEKIKNIMINNKEKSNDTSQNADKKKNNKRKKLLPSLLPTTTVTTTTIMHLKPSIPDLHPYDRYKFEHETNNDNKNNQKEHDKSEVISGHNRNNDKGAEEKEKNNHDDNNDDDDKHSSLIENREIDEHQKDKQDKPESLNEKVIPRCKEPMIIGHCRAHYIRFWYNITSNKCQDFTFGGCGENENNFQTVDECIKICSASGYTLRFNRTHGDPI